MYIFSVEGYIEDFQFAKNILKYEIFCSEIYLFKTANTKSLQILANNLISLRENDSFTKFLTKQIYTTGLGKMAFNSSKMKQKYTIFKIHDNGELNFFCKSKKKILIQDFGSNLFVLSQQNTKPLNYAEHSRIAYQNRSMSYLFGAINNRVRREMLNVILYAFNSKIPIARTVADSIILNIPKSQYDLFMKFLKGRLFNFKLEINNIKSVINRRSDYIMILHDGSVICKLLGFQLTLYERFTKGMKLPLILTCGTRPSTST